MKNPKVLSLASVEPLCESFHELFLGPFHVASLLPINGLCGPWQSHHHPIQLLTAAKSGDGEDDQCLQEANGKPCCFDGEEKPVLEEQAIPIMLVMVMLFKDVFSSVSMVIFKPSNLAFLSYLLQEGLAVSHLNWRKYCLNPC